MTDIKTHVALFAGLGGFILATEKLGIETILANEIDENCRKTLENNFPKLNIQKKDIRELSFKDIINDKNIDLVTAGFPCQSFSVAGDNKGFDDPRGKLFFEISRLLKELKNFPKIIILENVPNLKNYNSGERLAVIIKELRSMGYWVNQNNSMILNTNKYAKSPQSRDRLFIVALHSKFFRSNKISKDVLEEKKSEDLWKRIKQTKAVDSSYYLSKENKHYQMLNNLVKVHGKNFVYQVRRSDVRVATKEGVCPTLTANMGLGGHNIPFITDDFGIRTLTIEELSFLQGLSNHDFTFPDISKTAKLTMLGNAVHPDIVSGILDKILTLKSAKGDKNNA